MGPGVIADTDVGSLVGVTAIVKAVVLSLRREKTGGKGKVTIDESDNTLQRGVVAFTPTTPMAMAYNNEEYVMSDLLE